ncbi:MAG: HAMP domain-containing histidine kinase [Methylococcaceae bacterium]|nr:HAMP domain-containing histidine kinase [Methylococcaceae bacterium]
MRTSTKTLLAIALPFVLSFSVLAFLWEGQLRASVTKLMGQIALIVGEEIVSSLYQPVSDRLAGRRDVSDRELREILAAAKLHSDNIVSIDVTFPDGKIVGSDDSKNIGTFLLVPEYLFHEQSTARFTSTFDHPFGTGTHVLWAPILSEGVRLGYLRLLLRDRNIASLHEGLYSDLLIAALLGLLSIAAVGFLLRLELTRITKGLTELLETTAHGDVSTLSNRRDEFSLLRRAAGRIGGEIRLIKGEARYARRQLDVIANRIKSGLLLLDSVGTPAFVNPMARKLFCDSENDHFEVRFDSIRTEVIAAIEAMRRDRALSKEFDVTLDPERKHLRLELYPIDYEDWHGCVVVISDRDSLDAFNRDLQAAARLRGLSTLILGASHDLKTPLNAIAMNLSLLKDTTDSEDEKERRKHYLDIVEAELLRLQRMLQTLLDQTNFEERGKNRFDLQPIITELINLLKPQARLQQIEFELVLPEEPTPCFGYAGQIKSAVLNSRVQATHVLTLQRPEARTLVRRASVFFPSVALMK